MKMEGAFQYLHARQPDRIIEAALSTLGISRGCLLAAIGLGGREGDQTGNGDEMGAAEWWLICRFLHISADCYSYGYSPQEHRGRLFRALDAGEMRLLRTPELIVLARMSRDRRRQELQWRRRHMGLRLRVKVRWRELTEKPLQKLACRLHYLDVPRLNRRVDIEAIGGILGTPAPEGSGK